MARRKTSVLRASETQEEAAIAEEEDKGKAPLNTREELHQQAKSDAQDAPCTGGVQGCCATEQRRLTPMSNGNDKDKPFLTEQRNQANRQDQARVTMARLVSALGRRIWVQQRKARAERG